MHTRYDEAVHAGTSDTSSVNSSESPTLVRALKYSANNTAAASLEMFGDRSPNMATSGDKFPNHGPCPNASGFFSFLQGSQELIRQCFRLGAGIKIPRQRGNPGRALITGDGSDRFYWDDGLPGFGLRVRASGRKYYVVQFRANGRLRRMTLGRHGAVTPETARRRAMALISEAKDGKDPAALRDKGRKAATMKVLGRRFLEEYVPVHCKPSTAYEYQRPVKFFIDPRIGTRKVTEIQRSDIAELHHGMRETPYQANRTLGVLSKMFNLAELWGLRPGGSNPYLHVKRYKEEKRERFLNAEEFTRLGRVLDEILADGSETRSAVAAIRLLMLTGCRLSEIQKLRWQHVDLDAGELRLPDTKTGGRAVPLAPSAVRLLTSLPRDEDNPWVILGRKQGWHLTDLQHPWRRIRGRAGLDDVRIHDLRHSFASRALALGEGLSMIGKLLGHTQVQTTARYAHLARDTVKASAGRIGDSIDRDLDAAE